MSTFVSKGYGRGVLDAVPDVWPGLCVALLTDAPDVEAGVVDISNVEVPRTLLGQGSGYERADIPKAAWSDAVGNAPVTKPLEDDLVFEQAEQEWPLVKWVALMPTGESDSALIAVDLVTPILVRAGKVLRVPAGLFALRHVSV